MALVNSVRRTVHSTLSTIRFRLHMIRLVLSMYPVRGADDGTAGDGGAGGSGSGDGAGASGEGGSGDGTDGSGDGAGDGSNAIDSNDDWKTKARKHENENKRMKNELADVQKKLKDFEDASKSENEKAVEEAEKKGYDKASAEFSETRRGDRLAVAVAKHARELADVEDVVLNINNGIKSGDIDAADIFDKDDSVNTKSLESVLKNLLERKPHLKGGPNGRLTGDGDAGKGAGSSASEGGFNALVRDQARK